MSLAVDYPSFSRARDNLKSVLDATADGRMVTIARDGAVSAVLPAERLREYFFRTVSPRVKLFAEDGKVVALMDDRAFAAEGEDLVAALDDLVVALREYAEDWDLRLQHASNHSASWALVQLVKLSSDDQLLNWFDRGGE